MTTNRAARNPIHSRVRHAHHGRHNGMPAVACLLVALGAGCAASQAHPAAPAAAAEKNASTPPPASPASPAPPASQVRGPLQTVEGIREYALSNGLRVLLYPDATKPTVTVNLTYFVGSRHEGYGESGMAHLLEHMLFKGTPTRTDIWKLLQEHGARFNGTTWWDRTNYYEELKATPENLSFALELEADRMVNSKIAAEDLSKEFSVVRNEFEMGENSPPGVLEEKMFSTAYQWHNYGKTTIGSRSDIERVPADKLRAFYRKYYQPDNAMLIVAGAFDPQKVLEQVARDFGSIPKPTRELDRTYTVEPVQDGERSVTLRRNGDVSVVAAMYHTVAGADPDWLATDAISDILANEPAGRLYKALVETGLASEVWSNVYTTTDPGVLIAGAKVRPGGSPDKVREVLLQVVEGLGQHPVDASEVQRWRSKSQKAFDLTMTNTSGFAVALSDWAAMGDFRLFFQARDRLAQITPGDITRVAKNFFKPSNRTEGRFVPTDKPDRAPAVTLPDVASVLRDFKAKEQADEGEAFEATIENIEARTQRVTAPEGVKIALLPKKTKGRSVRISATVRWGSAADLKGKRGPASMIALMLNRGSQGRSFQAVKDELDRLKAEVSFEPTSPERPNVTAIHILTVRENIPAVLDLVAELLQKPAFSAREFEALRKQELTQLEEQRQDPMANGFRMLQQSIYPWPKDDLRHVPTVAEEIEELKRVDIKSVAALHRALWGGSATQIAVVGDMDRDATRAQLEKLFVGWKSPKPYKRVERPYQLGRTLDEALDTKDKEMAFVGVGLPFSMRVDDPDYPALLLFNHVLGGSVSSRLLTRLRHKGGLSYSAFSRLQVPPLDNSASFLAGAICAPQNIDKAMKALREEVDAILTTPVPDAELADAKKSYAANFANKLADDDFVAAELNQGLFLGRTFEFWKRVNAQLQAVTPAQMLEVAKKYVEPGRLASIKAGDLHKQAEPKP